VVDDYETKIKKEIMKNYKGFSYPPSPFSEPQIHVDLVDYIDLLYQSMGVDITYQEWHEMSDCLRINSKRLSMSGEIIEILD
jgi:hypothetical protein